MAKNSVCALYIRSSFGIALLKNVIDYIRHSSSLRATAKQSNSGNSAFKIYQSQISPSSIFLAIKYSDFPSITMYNRAIMKIILFHFFSPIEYVFIEKLYV